MPIRNQTIFVAISKISINIQITDNGTTGTASMLAQSFSDHFSTTSLGGSFNMMLTIRVDEAVNVGNVFNNATAV
jgi:hypothetical protein